MVELRIDEFTTRRGPKHPIFQAYEERLNRRGRKKETIDNFRKAIRWLEDWLEEKDLVVEELDSDLLEGYFAQLPLAPSTKKQHLVQIRAALRRATLDGDLPKDPTRHVELAPVSDRPVVVLKPAQIRKLLRAAKDEPTYLTIMIAAYTGMRRFEMAKLDWQDVDLEGRCIQVVGKRGKLRLVPIHPVLRDALLDTKSRVGPVLAGQKGGSKNNVLMDRLSQANKVAGIEVRRLAPDGSPFTSGVRFHDFRRTVASSLGANGVPDYLIDRIMGWSKQTVFDKHYRAVPEQLLHDAICRLYRNDPVGS